MSQSSSTWSRQALALVAAAAVLAALTTGTRGALGLFVGPINSATALGAATVSFAIALSHLTWGAAQPVLGFVAARHGAARVLACGAVLTALGTVLVAVAHDGLTFTASLAVLGIAIATAGSAPLLMAVVGQSLAPAQRGLAVGVVSAGGSVGQLLLAPATAFAITSVGWSGAMIALGLLALAALPLSGVLRAPANSDASRDRAPVTPSAGADTGLRDALRNRDYWLITVGFFVCGFHVTFLTTHMPGVIEMCGFSPNFAGAWLAIIGACNIAGTIGAGWLMQRVPMKLILGALYALRGLGVALFLIAPKTEFVLLAFAVWMGLSYLATLPPTTGLIAQLFGMRHVGVLLGLTMFAHQIGSFLGAWLGGLERQWHGSYTWTWLLDIALALVAAAVHAPIRERAPADPVPAERVSSEPATTISRRPSTSPRTLHPLAAR